MSDRVGNRPDFLKSGVLARLIPVEKDGNQERKAASSLLAILMAVEEFGRKTLESVGAPVTKRSRISCFTEISFKDDLPEGKKEDRPDGLIIVETGKNKWKAIVEAKVQTQALDQDQIERYLDLAKKYSVDAVITISNQFAPLPTHHPVKLGKRSLKGVGLFHWSWTYLLTEAFLLGENKNVSDPDQAYMLGELVRFLRHQNSGVTRFNHMGSSWKDVCTAFKFESNLSKNSDEIENVVSNWYQLGRYLTLQISEKLAVPVTQHLSKPHRDDPLKRLQEDSELLASKGLLEASFDIPNAASNLQFTVDLKKRLLNAAMNLKAPQDKKRAKSSVHWFVKQINGCQDDDIFLRVNWAKRTRETNSKLGQVRETLTPLITEKSGVLPKSFEVSRFNSPGGGFSSPKKFVETSEMLLTGFYEDIGQLLRSWTPKPPKVKHGTDIEKQAISEGEKPDSEPLPSQKLSKWVFSE